jgi:hypothetical protein
MPNFHGLHHILFPDHPATEHSFLSAKWKFSFSFACAVDLEILKEAPRCHTESAEEKIWA